MDEQRRGAAVKGAVGSSVDERRIVVDPRPFVNTECEIWRFSYDVHKNMFVFLTAIWGALRNIGVNIPPLTYGKTWILFEPSAGRTINPQTVDEASATSLYAAGIRPGTSLLVMSPESVPQER